MAKPSSGGDLLNSPDPILWVLILQRGVRHGLESCTTSLESQLESQNLLESQNFK